MKQKILHRQSALQDLSFEVYVVVLVEGPPFAFSLRFDSPLRARVCWSLNCVASS